MGRFLAIEEKRADAAKEEAAERARLEEKRIELQQKQNDNQQKFLDQLMGIVQQQQQQMALMMSFVQKSQDNK